MNVAVPVLQLVAYVMLTLASIIVAAVSTIIAFRSNFGWRPLALVLSHGIRGVGGSDLFDATLDIEVWNRRKYPIVMRQLEVQFNSIKLRDTAVQPPWHLTGNRLVNYGQTVIAPSTYEQIPVTAPMSEGIRLDDISDLSSIPSFFQT